MFHWLPGFLKRRRAFGLLEYGDLSSDSAGIPSAPYLARFCKNDSLKPSISGEELGLRLVRAEGNNTGICLADARYHMLLFYRFEGRAFSLANIGFNLNIFFPTIRMRQIQSKKYDSIRCANVGDEQRERMVNIMRSLRWEKMLVQAVCDWAAANGFSRAAILKAKYNPWRIGMISFAAIDHHERLKMHYDVTAQRMGFKESLFSRYWHKRLVPSC